MSVFLDASIAFSIEGHSFKNIRFYLPFFFVKPRKKRIYVKYYLFFIFPFSFYNNLIRKIKNLLLFLRVFIYDNK